METHSHADGSTMTKNQSSGREGIASTLLSTATAANHAKE
jgi:hypothetical protein